MIEYNSATRVDLCGGTLDCWPLYLLVPEAITINMAISVMATARLEARKDKRCIVDVSDLNFKAEFNDVDALISSTDEKLLLVREVVRELYPKTGFHLSTSSQSPIGGGLGGSSTLTISLIKAFRELGGRPVKESEVHKIVHMAHNIEARILSTPTGTQDYIPAYLGGLNAIHYRASGIDIEHLQMDATRLSDRMMLIYTGRPHHSGLNNWQVIKAAIDKDKNTLRALNDIAEVSHKIYDELKSGRVDQLTSLFNLESDARIRLSPGFTSPEIDRLRADCLELGGDALKICGAGGGGCVLIWADPSVHARIEGACEKSGFKRLPLRPVERLERKPLSLIEAF